ncbi:MAG: AgmX/PglI C-terminal domain-containing protein [Pseudomonadales bacterium]
MSTGISTQQQDLSAQLAEAQQQAEALERELHALDAELQALAPRGHQYRLLEEVLVSLEKLDGVGASELFWGERAPPEGTAEHVLWARGLAAGFHDEVAAVEQRRQALVERMDGEHELREILQDELFELEQQEERRRNEWVVEREVSDLPLRPAVMPWARGSGDDDQLFRRSLAASVVFGLLFGLLLPLVDLPIPTRAEKIEVPERLARLIKQEPPRPTPPPQVAREEPKPEEVRPEPVTEPKPAPEPQPRQEAPAPQVAEQPSVRARTETTGILAFRESFSNLADGRPSTQLGAQARISNAGQSTTGRTERSMVTTQAPGSSGGINTAALSRNVGGPGGGLIEGVALTRVASSIGGSGGQDRPLSDGPSAGRTDEEIQIVFDRYKAALYRIYNRELRNDPTLRGQLVLRLTIEPDGSVSLCDVRSSELDSPEVARQVVERVRGFNFGAKVGIPAMTILYPIDFLPAA